LWSHKDQDKLHSLVFDLTAPERQPKVVRGVEAGALVLSPDGRNLAISAWGGWRVIDLDTDQERWFGQEHKVFVFAFSPDSRRIVTSAPGGADLRQIDLATGAVVNVYRGHKGDVSCAAYSPDGRWLVSGGRDRTVRLWSLERDESLVLHGHADDVRQLAFSADGAYVASLGEQGEARLWDMRGPGVLRGHTSYVYGVAFSPDGRWLASGGWDKCVRLWDAAERAPLAVLGEHNLFVSALAIHPDGERLVSLCQDYSLRVWDTGGKRQGRVFAKGPWVNPSLPHQIQFSPDGRKLAVGDNERVRLWDAATLRECESLPVPIGNVRQVAFSPDGRRLAAGGGQEVVILDATTGSQKLSCRLEREITAIAFSPDGQRLLTADREGEARLWDTASGTVQATLRGHVGEVFAAAFHPSGRRLATAGRDRTIRLWDVARGEEVLKLTGHTDYVFALAFSPDGATLASGSGDATVRLWDTVPLRERHQARRELAARRP
jgi:WD40 repeat protein